MNNLIIFEDENLLIKKIYVYNNYIFNVFRDKEYERVYLIINCDMGNKYYRIDSPLVEKENRTFTYSDELNLKTKNITTLFENIIYDFKSSDSIFLLSNNRKQNLINMLEERLREVDIYPKQIKGPEDLYEKEN